MSDKLETLRVVLFRGIEVVEGQQVPIPIHNVVSATRDTLPQTCSSTTGIIIISKGYPDFVVKARCVKADKVDTDACFFSTRI